VLEGLFPDGAVIEWGDPRDAAKPLFPEEEALVKRAVPKRRRELEKGRECARVALARLGVEAAPLLAGAKREPLWPPGIVGSITHTAHLCIVAVARADRYAGLGIDAEPAEPLEPEIVGRILRSDETIAPPPSIDAALVPRLVFCAKEAAYKCQFPLTRTLLGFEDVRVRLGEGVFEAELMRSAPPLSAGHALSGRWLLEREHLVAAAWIECGPAL